MKPYATRKVQAQRKFAQGAYTPAVTSAAVPEKKPVEPAREGNIIRNHVPARTLLDIVSFKNIHAHLQPVVVIQRMLNITLDTNKKQKNMEPTTQNKKKIPITKKKFVRTKKPHNWDMKLRSRAVVKSTRSSEPNTPTEQTHTHNTRNTHETTHVRKRKNSEPELPKAAKRRDCTEIFTSDDCKPLTFFAKTGVKTFRTEKKKQRLTKKTNLKKPKTILKKTLDTKKKTSPPKVMASTSRQDPVEASNSAAAVSKSPIMTGQSPMLLATGPDDGTAAVSKSPTLPIQSTTLLRNGVPRDVFEPILSPSVEVNPPSTKVAKPSPTVAKPSPTVAKLSPTVAKPFPIVAKPCITAKKSAAVESNKSPNLSPTKTVVVEPQPGPSTAPPPSSSLTFEPLSFTPLPPEAYSPCEFFDNECDEPYYNSNEIQRWITGSDKDKDSDLCPPPAYCPPPARCPPPPRCPATAWLTLKQVIEAPAQELQARCKKCATCLKVAKLIMLSRFLTKYRVVECTGEEEDSHEPRDNTMLSQDGDLYMELLPKHNLFMIKLKIQTLHSKPMLSARLVPRSEAHTSKELSLIEHDSILDQLIKMLNLNTMAPSSICSPDSETESHAFDTVKTESVIDLTQTDQFSVRSEGRSDAGSQQCAFPKSVDRAKVVEAPVFYPTKEEFADPIAYFKKIAPVASRYGLCKIIPPPTHWVAPKCKIDDDIRFDVIKQYISRLYSRWGPAAREMCAIKACLRSQNLNLTRSPLLDGIEVNLAKLYHVVQRNGGLQKVIDKKRWGRVAQEMSFSTTPNPEKKLDQIYVKYLLPYDTLTHKERQEIIRKVEKRWNKCNQKMLDRALNPLHRQKRLLGESESSDEETSDDSEVGSALAEAEDCIVPGSSMNLTKFKRVAAIVLENNFQARDPPPLVVENQYWSLLLLGMEHVCVNTASIDTGEEGYGFSKNRKDPYSEHPWNLKMLSQNSGNVLRSLGPVLGLTVPTLHLGMVFSTSCWHSDPHGLPWIEYMHQGSPKIWYGIPNEQSQNFRKAVETLCPTSCQNKSIWLPSDISMIPPTLLLEHNVSMCRMTQKPGEFIMVFPKAFSCSISTGYTLSESVYFATHSWLNSVHLVFQELRESCEPSMFSLEQLLLAVAQDARTPLDVLQQAHATLCTILTDERQCREDLRAMALPFIIDKKREHVTNKKRRNTSAWNVRDLDECEVCRMTLYLSKVSELPGRKSSVCLQHALQLLEARGYEEPPDELQVVIYVPEDELDAVLKKVQERLLAGVASSSSQQPLKPNL